MLLEAINFWTATNCSSVRGDVDLCRETLRSATRWSPNERGRVRFVSRESERDFAERFQNVRVHAVLGGLRDAQDLIVRFGLINVWQKPLRVLSGGELRKLSLALAMSASPEMLVLDQPYDGLDRTSRRILSDLVREMSEGFAPLLIGTHTARSCASAGAFDGRTPEDPTRIVLATQRLNEETLDGAATLCLEGHSSSDSLLNGELSNLLRFVYGSPSSDDETTLVAVSDLSVRSQNDEEEVSLLCDVDWRIQKGQSWMIRGANGSGKSTLLRCIADASVGGYSSDEWRLKGEIYVHPSVRGCASKRQNGGGVVVFTDRTDEASLGEYGSSKDSSFATSRTEYFQEHGLVCGDMSTGSSRGQIQMQGFWNALSRAPNLWIIDEGFYGLDEHNRKMIRNVLEMISKQRLASILLVSHHDDDILSSANGYITIDKGYVSFDTNK